MQKKKPNLLGQTFGDLFVVGKVKEEGQYSKWNCLCSCGGQRVVSTRPLINGTTTACTHHNKKLPEVRTLKDAQSIGALRSHPHFQGMVLGLKIDPLAGRMASFIKPWDIVLTDDQILIKCNWHGPVEESAYGVIAIENIHQALDANRQSISGDRKVRIHCPIEGDIPMVMELDSLQRKVSELTNRLGALEEATSG